MLNFLKIGPSIAEILRFSIFQMATATIFNFLIRKILLATKVQRAHTHHRSKFH